MISIVIEKIFWDWLTNNLTRINYLIGGTMTIQGVEAYTYGRKKLLEKLNRGENPRDLWTIFQVLVGFYQRNHNITFIVLPEIDKMKEFLEEHP